MTNLRQAAQQALEALEAALSDDQPYIERCKQTRTALRAALAEDALQRLTDVQQEMEAHDPVDYRGWVLREVLFYNGEPVSHREPEQEPVVDCPRCGHCCPQRKPLTGEEIDNCWYQSGGVTPGFARAIEAAHGIKGEA